jgi:hypothetical protein
LYEAIHAAEREKARAKPGLCPRLPFRRVEVVKRPIPHLERGTGTGKVTIRIAVCGVSKSWRDKNPDEFRKYAHLFNMKETTRPDVTSFLASHPMVHPDDHGDDNDNDSRSDYGLTQQPWAVDVKLEGGQAGNGDEGNEGGVNVDFPARDDEEYDKEEGGASMEILEIRALAEHGTIGTVSSQKSPGASEGLNVVHKGTYIYLCIYITLTLFQPIFPSTR